MRLPVNAPTTPANQHFTALQRKWMDELLPRHPPPETEATCSRCAMLPHDGAVHTVEHYDPRSKCCTYLPMLHNFLLGEILFDEDPHAQAGRRTVEKRLAEGKALTPLGLYAPQEYLDRYDAGAKFGHDISLRCPHYQETEGYNCGVWKFRESTCSAWFCKYSSGEGGRSFWKEGAAPLLRAVELQLAAWCAEELGATTSEWGPWEGRARDLFRACTRLVEPLRWRDLERIGGSEVHKLARKTVDLLSHVTG